MMSDMFDVSIAMLFCQRDRKCAVQKILIPDFDTCKKKTGIGDSLDVQVVSQNLHAMMFCTL